MSGTNGTAGWGIKTSGEALVRRAGRPWRTTGATPGAGERIGFAFAGCERAILATSRSLGYHSLTRDLSWRGGHTFATREGLVSFSRSAAALPARFRLILTSFLQRPGLAFADALPEERIQAAFDEHSVAFAQGEDEFYTPPLTLWAFLSQVLFHGEQRSCAAAVSRVVVLLVALGREPPSDNTGAYCRARAKLPVAVIRRLACEVAERCERQVPASWLWHGRHVKLVDGSTCGMPDTKANRAEYPQPPTQKAGLGFPLARFVVLLSLATAMVSDLAIGPYAGKETGETALLRELLGRLDPDDILLADRYFCSYFMICLLLAAKVDFVTRLHQRRTADFRRGRRLGAGDHVVAWSRPARPDWMDQATYERMPESIELRKVEFVVTQPGFRTEVLVVVTTLADARRYTRDEIAELYHRRWLAEVYQPQCPSSSRLYQLAARGKSIGRGVVAAGVLVLPAGGRKPLFHRPTQARRLSVATVVPPRPTNPLLESATRVPLEQLWTRLPAKRRQELLGHLTRLVAQRLAPPDGKEVADE